MTKVEDVQEYYANLLILQYKNKPKARATIKTMAELYLGDGLVFDIQDVLDIDKAEGAQLDIIGKILGCPRNIPGFTIDTPYFSYETAPEPHGFSDKNELSDGFFKRYNNSIGSIYSLKDIPYRQLLKFKAIYNLRRGSWSNLDEIYYTFFGDDIELINNEDLSVTFNIKAIASVATRAAIFLDYIKPPLGISYNYNYI